MDLCVQNATGVRLVKNMAIGQPPPILGEYLRGLADQAGEVVGVASG
jgi:hypothetical protein